MGSIRFLFCHFVHVFKNSVQSGIFSCLQKLLLGKYLYILHFSWLFCLSILWAFLSGYLFGKITVENKQQYPANGWISGSVRSCLCVISFINIFDVYCVSKKYEVLEPSTLKSKNQVLENMFASLRVKKKSIWKYEQRPHLKFKRTRD